MYQNMSFTGLIASEIKKTDEGEVLFVAKSVKAFTDKAGALKTATANIIVAVTGKYAVNIAPRLFKGARIFVRGSIMADEKGGPIINEDEKRGVWVAFNCKASSISIIGVLKEGQQQEDEFSIILVGNLGKEPEMRYLPNGEGVTNFSMATNSTHKVDGQNVKETIWWRITAWGKQAETANEYLHKGSRCLVEGALIFDPETGGPRLWDRNDGTQGASFEITLFTYKLLDKKGDGPESTYQGKPDGGFANEGGDSYDDEIPF